MRAWAAEWKIEDKRTREAKRHRSHVRLEVKDLLHIRRHRDYADIPEIDGVATILGPTYGRCLLAFRLTWRARTGKKREAVKNVLGDAAILNATILAARVKL